MGETVDRGEAESEPVQGGLDCGHGYYSYENYPSLKTVVEAAIANVRAADDTVPPLTLAWCLRHFACRMNVEED